MRLQKESRFFLSSSETLKVKTQIEQNKSLNAAVASPGLLSGFHNGSVLNHQTHFRCRQNQIISVAAIKLLLILRFTESDENSLRDLFRNSQTNLRVWRWHLSSQISKSIITKGLNVTRCEVLGDAWLHLRRLLTPPPVYHTFCIDYFQLYILVCLLV